MTLLNEEQREIVKNYFDKEMKDNIKIILFTQKINCEYCPDTEMILKEVSELSDKITLEIKNFLSDEEDVKEYGIERVPAIVFLKGNGEDTGIRFYGIPSGYEFTSLIETIVMVSKSDSGLSENVKEKLKNIDKEINIKVFVTPSCPYCPRMVILANKVAFENKNIKTNIIEVIEFPELGEKYNVFGVPKTVINENIEFEGAVPEGYFIENLEKATKGG
ncbi:MAG: thioredoxin family protein [candidate division WOR-3 bacterium]